MDLIAVAIIGIGVLFGLAWLADHIDHSYVYICTQTLNQVTNTWTTTCGWK